MTCNKIEELVKSEAGKNSKLKFRSINVDDKRNAKCQRKSKQPTPHYFSTIPGPEK
jgi:hypothetical protein